MGHAGPLRQGRLSRADIQPAIDLHGINRDNLPVELFGEPKRGLRFTDCRWPCKEQRARIEDGGWRMVFGFGCHLLSSMLYSRFVSWRGSTRNSTRPAARMTMLTRCAGVAQPPR